MLTVSAVAYYGSRLHSEGKGRRDGGRLKGMNSW